MSEETSDELYKGYVIRRRGIYKRQVQEDVPDAQATIFNRPRDAYAYIDALTEEPPVRSKAKVMPKAKDEDDDDDKAVKAKKK